MKRHLTLAIAITLAVPWFSALHVSAQTPIAYPEPLYVSDYANVLSPDQENALAQKVLQFKQETSNEIAILVVPTTEPETIEQYSIHVTDKWKIGKKNKDNGLLLTVAVNDRKMRFEVGRGLEGAIPDITATKILDVYARPEFKQGKYYEGITIAIDQVMALAKGEFSEAEIPDPAAGASSSENDDLFSIIFYGAIAGFSFFTNYLAKSKSWWFGGIAGGIAAFVISLLLSVGVIGALFLAGIFGVFGLIVDYIVSKNYGKTGSGKNNWWFFGGGGGSGGGWGSGGGSSFGGGGFSGGGGSSSW